MAGSSTAPAVTPLITDSLRNQAVRTIRSQVISGGIAAGQLYPVSYFASQLGVSPTPIRDALFDLAHEGLVEVVRNRGFRVVALSDHDLDDIFQLRQFLEVPATAQAAGKLRTEDVEQCHGYVRHIEASAATGDVTGFLEADRSFHLHILQVLGNHRLVDLVGRLRDQVRLYNIPNLAKSGGLVESAQEHRYILDALVEGDKSRVEVLMQRHLEHTRGLWAGREESISSRSVAVGDALSTGR